MSNLSELYQEVILDHNRKPRNFRVIEEPSQAAEGRNPLCGDQLTVYLKIDDGGVIEDVSFKGSGCAISKAAASLMTVTVKGKTLEQAERLFHEFHEMVTGKLDASAEGHGLGRLTVFAGVTEFPARVKCASLAWHTLHSALAGGGVISTE